MDNALCVDFIGRSEANAPRQRDLFDARRKGLTLAGSHLLGIAYTGQRLGKKRFICWQDDRPYGNRSRERTASGFIQSCHMEQTTLPEV
jgi:hypothetical protein